MVETGGAQVIVVSSPKCFAARAGDPGLRPGLAIDLCATKTHGPHDGQPRDLSSAADEKKHQDVIDFQQQVLVAGSPPCTISSSFRNPAARKETPTTFARPSLHQQKEERCRAPPCARASIRMFFLDTLRTTRLSHAQHRQTEDDLC